MPLETPLLDLVSEPSDLRRLGAEQLEQVCAELRAEVVDAVSGDRAVIWVPGLVWWS